MTVVMSDYFHVSPVCMHINVSRLQSGTYPEGVRKSFLSANLDCSLLFISHFNSQLRILVTSDGNTSNLPHMSFQGSMMQAVEAFVIFHGYIGLKFQQ